MFNKKMIFVKKKLFNIGLSKYIKQILTGLEEEIDNSTITLEDLTAGQGFYFISFIVK